MSISGHHNSEGAPATKEQAPENTGGYSVGSHDKENANLANDNDNFGRLINQDFQHGVQRVQAVTQLWGKKQLVLAYIL